jgi:hypothetical protein
MRPRRGLPHTRRGESSVSVRGTARRSGPDQPLQYPAHDQPRRGPETPVEEGILGVRVGPRELLDPVVPGEDPEVDPVGAGGTQRLSRLVGPSRAKDLIFTGRFVKADEALAIGLVDRVVPPERVYDEAVAWAAQFTGAAALALRAAKESVDRGLEVDLNSGLEIERAAFAALFATADRATGMRSFVEQGPGKASFEGR